MLNMAAKPRCLTSSAERSIQLRYRQPSNIVERRTAMLFDECRWIEPAARIITITRSDKRRNELAHLEMEMRKISPIGCPNRGDLLTASHLLARMHQHLIDMSVIRLHICTRAIVDVGVQHDDDVAPSRATIAREQNPSIRDTINRIAQVAVFAADAVEIVAEMFVLSETLCVVSERAVFAPQGEIETRRRRGRSQLKR